MESNKEVKLFSRLCVHAPDTTQPNHFAKIILLQLEKYIVLPLFYSDSITTNGNSHHVYDPITTVDVHKSQSGEDWRSLKFFLSFFYQYLYKMFFDAIESLIPSAAVHNWETRQTCV